MAPPKVVALLSLVMLLPRSAAAQSTEPPPETDSDPSSPGAPNAANPANAPAPANPANAANAPAPANPANAPTPANPAAGAPRDPADAGQRDSGAPSPQTASTKTAVFEPGEVTIRSQRPSVIDRAATQTVVTSRDIEAHGDRTLADTLSLIPGLSIYQHGKGHIRFRMRGFEMPYVALLVDGIPIADVYEANVDISKLLVMNASQIVINRGTCSALYGTNGTIGSINIITKRPLELYAKAQAEMGANGDYTLNTAYGNAHGPLYYWVTATVDKQAPFNVSAALRPKSWLNRAMPSGLGYNIDYNSAAATLYRSAKEWPHQEAVKYNLTGKTGYTFPGGVETGLEVSFTQSQAKRYSLSLNNTEEYTQGAWPKTDPTLTLGGSAFHWRDVHTVSAAPYVQYKGERATFTGNLYYLNTYEFLDGYQDIAETVPVTGWGGAHSNWINTSSGFNLFPSYAISDWNRLHGSILFRWDKHLEREQADGAFVGKGQAGGGADAAYALAGDGWFDTKLMTGEQLTVAVEDEIALKNLVSVPIDISAGVSYDAQKLETYRARQQTMAQGRVTSFGAQMEDQYIAKSDAGIFGTRDSLNPVFGVTYKPIEDLLLLRGSYSRKTKLPTMSQYANVLANSDVGLKPETSDNVNAGFQLFFGHDVASLRADYFYSSFRHKLATIYDPATPSIKYYANIRGEDHQGVETIVNAKTDGLFGLLDLDTSLSYTFLHLRNLATDEKNSLIVKGQRLADIPEHEVTMDVRVGFPSGTSLNFFGTYTANAIKYTMQANPGPGTAFSTSNYREISLHDPFLVNLRVGQKLLDKYELYALIRNLFDDYAADPFNPGPGRQFYLGARAEY